MNLVDRGTVLAVCGPKSKQRGDSWTHFTQRSSHLLFLPCGVGKTTNCSDSSLTLKRAWLMSCADCQRCAVTGRRIGTPSRITWNTTGNFVLAPSSHCSGSWTPETNVLSLARAGRRDEPEIRCPTPRRFEKRAVSCARRTTVAGRPQRLSPVGSCAPNTHWPSLTMAAAMWSWSKQNGCTRSASREGNRKQQAPRLHVRGGRVTVRGRSPCPADHTGFVVFEIGGPAERTVPRCGPVFPWRKIRRTQPPSCALPPRNRRTPSRCPVTPSRTANGFWPLRACDVTDVISSCCLPSWLKRREREPANCRVTAAGGGR